jgi:hypothetical protein
MPEQTTLLDAGADTPARRPRKHPARGGVPVSQPVTVPVESANLTGAEFRAVTLLVLRQRVRDFKRELHRAARAVDDASAAPDSAYERAVDDLRDAAHRYAAASAELRKLTRAGG